MEKCSECGDIGGRHFGWCTKRNRGTVLVDPQHVTLHNAIPSNRQSVGVEAADPEDVVNHPNHYMAFKGLEVIDLTEQMNFNRGNAVKYICRAGLKDPEKTVEDLEKAAWYIAREIKRVKEEA